MGSRTYAAVYWCPEDIEILRPEWSRARIEEFMDRYAGSFQDRITELGWEVWGVYLGMEGEDDGPAVGETEGGAAPRCPD